MACTMVGTTEPPNAWTNREATIACTVLASRARHRRDDVKNETGEQRTLAPEAIGQRPEQQLADPEADEEGGKGE